MIWECDFYLRFFSKLHNSARMIETKQILLHLCMLKHLSTFYQQNVTEKKGFVV